MLTYEATQKTEAKREKERARSAKYRAENPEKYHAYAAKYRAKNTEKVRARRVKYRAENLEKERARHAKYKAQNPEKIRAYLAKYRAENPEKHRAAGAKYRAEMQEASPRLWAYTQKKAGAKKLGIAFTIGPDDFSWPSHCPALGIQLNSGGSRDNTPSFDRIDPRYGYVPGNVVVVSMRANRMKSDASAAELQALALFYKRMEEAHVKT